MASRSLWTLCSLCHYIKWHLYILYIICLHKILKAILNLKAVKHLIQSFALPPRSTASLLPFSKGYVVLHFFYSIIQLKVFWFICCSSSGVGVMLGDVFAFPWGWTMLSNVLLRNETFISWIKINTKLNKDKDVFYKTYPVHCCEWNLYEK
jgi:hypothetical protein